MKILIVVGREKTMNNLQIFKNEELGEMSKIVEKDNKTYKKITEVCNKFQNDVDELYENLKEGCKTYDELESRLMRMQREILWNHPEFNKTPFELLKKKLDDEKKGLPIKKDSL